MKTLNGEISDKDFEAAKSYALGRFQMPFGRRRMQLPAEGVLSAFIGLPPRLDSGLGELADEDIRLVVGHDRLRAAAAGKPGRQHQEDENKQLQAAHRQPVQFIRCFLSISLPTWMRFCQTSRPVSSSINVRFRLYSRW